MTTTGDDITMYRDAAVVRQRFVLDLPTGATTTKVEIAANVAIDKVLVIDRGELQITGLHAALSSDETTEAIAQDTKDAGSGSETIYDEEDPPPDPTEVEAEVIKLSMAKPTELRLDVIAPRAGHFTIQLAYVTDRMKWDAAYTMTATPARDRALLRGAVAIRNTTAIGLHVARVHLIDAELGTWRGKIAEHLASALVGGEPSATRPAASRDLGVVDVIQGETRLELLPDDSPRRMRSVLVYDPFGTKLDNPGTMPSPDPQLGVAPAASTRITESFEVERDEAASAGLPAGPVRLLERLPDGSLTVLGESRLFDAATRVAEVDTIPVGTAEAVVAHRERRELTNDEERHRLTEEFQITVDNDRPTPVGVLLREHLYRGQNWTLAYHSAPNAAKEGAQQIALRTTVPPRGQAKVVYVVVYTWQP